MRKTEKNVCAVFGRGGRVNKLRCAEKIGLGKQLDDDGNAWPALSLAQAIRNRHGSKKGSIFQASIRLNIAKTSPQKSVNAGEACHQVINQICKQKNQI